MKLKESALVGLMTAVLCIIGPLAVPLPFSPVPVSATNLALFLILYVLGRKRGCVCYLLYLLMGLIGLPVFSAFTGGPGRLFGPTGGYLAGFLFMMLVSGWFIDRWYDRPVICFFAMLAGMMICYLFGTLWLLSQTGLSFVGALAVGVAPFILGDMIKLVLAAAGGTQLKKHLHRAGFYREK